MKRIFGMTLGVDSTTIGASTEMSAEMSTTMSTIMSTVASALVLTIVLSSAFVSRADGTPKPYPGKRTPGTSRSICPPTALKITALVPYQDTQKSTKTTSGNPIVWVYMPYSRSQGNTFDLELRITDEQGETIRNISLPEKPGIMPIFLPSKTTFEIGKSYGWSLTAKCDTSIAVDIKLTIDRIAALPKQPLPSSKSQANIEFYDNNHIWLNAITEVFKLNAEQPTLKPEAQKFLLQKLDGEDLKGFGMAPDYLQQIIQQPIVR